MFPFHVDPRWYEEHWYGDRPDESEAEAIRSRRSAWIGRIAIWIALVAAIPAVSYLGFRAAGISPASLDRLPVRLG